MLALEAVRSSSASVYMERQRHDMAPFALIILYGMSDTTDSVSAPLLTQVRE